MFKKNFNQENDLNNHNYFYYYAIADELVGVIKNLINNTSNALQDSIYELMKELIIQFSIEKNKALGESIIIVTYQLVDYEKQTNDSLIDIICFMRQEFVVNYLLIEKEGNDILKYFKRIIISSSRLIYNVNKKMKQTLIIYIEISKN